MHFLSSEKGTTIMMKAVREVDVDGEMQGRLLSFCLVCHNKNNSSISITTITN
jgi:hypothetical protein